MKLLFSVVVVLMTTTVQAKCYQDIDKFTGTEFHWCGAWGTGGVMLGGLNGLDPIPYAIKNKGGDYSYYIKLVSDQYDWSNISEGDKLLFLVDGDVHEMVISGRSEKDIDSSNEFKGVTAVETSLLPTTREFMKLISNSSEVEFALYTSKGRQERKLHKAAKKHYGDLLKKIK